VKCIKCSGDDFCKNGVITGIQRFKCKDCGYNFTKGRTSKPLHLKRLALQLYLEGLGFRSIGRILKVSHVSVYRWIRNFGQKAEELRSESEIFVMEIDEMHSYIGSKKNHAGSGLLLIDMERNSSILSSEINLQTQVKPYLKT
jgi:transposase-like protein